jgi:hypothetical protein
MMAAPVEMAAAAKAQLQTIGYLSAMEFERKARLA